MGYHRCLGCGVMTGMPESHPICAGEPPHWLVCTCGSGGHPRRCEEHPGAYEEHLRGLNAEGADETQTRMRQVAPLEAWRRERPVLFSSPDLNPEQSRAVIGHLMRHLSRGRIPPIGPLKEYLDGKATLPPCGYIGCTWAESHTH
jgi:hypothetical protein